MDSLMPAGSVHLGRNIDSLQQQLGVSDDAMLAALGLSYNRFWDMKRRDWAQKKTVEQVALAFTQVTGLTVTPEQVLTGRLSPEQFASRAVEAFIQRAAELEGDHASPLGGVRLPRLMIELSGNGSPPAQETAEPSQVVGAEPGDFVITAEGDDMLPTLADGDELVCCHAETASEGDLVLVAFANEDGHWHTGVRRYQETGDHAWLSCDNRSADTFGRALYPDVHPSAMRVIGRVVGLWRSLDQR